MSQVIDFEQQRRLYGYAKRVTAARIKILLNERRFANGAIAVEAFELERDTSVAELLQIQAEIEATEGHNVEAVGYSPNHIRSHQMVAFGTKMNRAATAA